jgi:hypothetical protein
MALDLSETEVATRPGRKTVPIEEVDRLVGERVAEFESRQEEMIDAAVAAHLAKIEASLETARAAAPGATSDISWMATLAQEIARVSNGGVGQKTIPPEEIERRKVANEKLLVLLETTFKAGVQPTYRLTNVCYLGEQIIRPIYIDRATKMPSPTEIGWWAIPNEFMHPTNEQAEGIHSLFLESIGGHKKVARLGITAGGLTVRSGGMDPSGGSTHMPGVGRDMPTIRGKANETHSIETRILGTLMQPARQMV